MPKQKFSCQYEASLYEIKACLLACLLASGNFQRDLMQSNSIILMTVIIVSMFEISCERPIDEY